MARRLSNGNDMKRIDGVRNSLPVNHHDDFWMERNKILMRHPEFPPIGQLQSEGLKSVMQPVSNLFDEHAANLPVTQAQINVFHNFNSASGTAKDQSPSKWRRPAINPLKKSALQFVGSQAGWKRGQNQGAGGVKALRTHDKAFAPGPGQQLFPDKTGHSWRGIIPVVPAKLPPKVCSSQAPPSIGRRRHERSRWQQDSSRRAVAVRSANLSPNKVWTGSGLPC